MLPKVANQLIHHTSRAVAVVQNQTGHTIRNVLHLQTSSPTVGNRSGPGSSNSGKGSNGAGAGARQSSSSRFYNSYSALSRSVTQADPSLLHSTNNELIDDVEDTPASSSSATSARRMRHRSRSHSLTLGAHDAKAEKVGLLQALQQHVRARHAFAVSDATSTRALEDEADTADEAPAPATQTEDVEVEDAEMGERLAQEEELIAGFLSAQNPQDAPRAFTYAARLRKSTHAHSTAVWNEAFNALLRTRTPGQPLRPILELYNIMVSRSVVPDVQTYSALIVALTDRDYELHQQITMQEERVKNLTALGQFSPQARRIHEHKIAALRAENNLSSAMLLFQAACHIPRHNIPVSVYLNLLRSCAQRGNVDAALRVFAQVERRRGHYPLPRMYLNLISAYDNHGDINGAQDVFMSFRRAAETNALHLDKAYLDQSGQPTWRIQYLGVWNSMITAYLAHGKAADALALLQEMVGPEASAEFECGGVPAPSQATYTRLIKGFIGSGDIDSALIWFDKLLEQPSTPANPFAPCTEPPRPSERAWSAMIHALSSAQRISDLDRIVARAIHENMYSIHPLEHAIIVHAHIRHLDSRSDLPKETILTELDRLHAQHIRYDVIRNSGSPAKFWDLCDEIMSAHLAMARLRLKHGDYDGTISVIEDFVKAAHQDNLHVEGTKEVPALVLQGRLNGLRRFLSHVSVVMLQTPELVVPLQPLLRWANLSQVTGMAAEQPIASYYVAAYLRSSPSELDTLTIQEWHSLLEAATNVVNGARIGKPSDKALLKPCTLPTIDLVAVVEDYARRGHEASSIPHQLWRYLARVIHDVHSSPDAGLLARLDALGPSYAELKEIPDTGSRLQTPESAQAVPLEVVEPGLASRIKIDSHHSRYVEEYTAPFSGVSAVTAYERVIIGQQILLYPRVDVFARLINTLGREKEVQKVRHLYQLAQVVLAALEADRKAQSAGWFQLEDAMVIAFAHAGDLNAAHVHRMRILQQGGSPSADAYGALIERVANTTDDTENAWQLYQEALAHGVKANIYLFNTIISKLAKARKADQALELFAQMKTNKLRPTSVTYGALIAACCRVGDVVSAEALFEEMTSQSNFKPRVPPYNTMMQLYTQTKPDRARALHYYSAMLDAGVHPTAHTYKLLIDAYGAIEPIDIPAMEDAFERTVADPKVIVQGTHWAALINAYGCAQKDLGKAIETFESIASHPSTRRSRTHLPDEVVFEALMNVFVRLRRPDLMAEYQTRMPALGIRMTAYIANFLIKGYAASGNIEYARALFEALADPPTGVAAPNNHAPHEDQPASPSPIVITDGVVFREPSTWETMVRAELGHGNRDHAIALLQRVQARGFPPAVYNRISGIMPDVSVSPWGSGSEASAPSVPSTP